MNTLRNFTAWAAALAIVISATPAFAVVNIDWVTVGDAGNIADPITGYGAVAREYQIGKYEVTNAQYAEFLNAKATSDPYGLYSIWMAGYGITRNDSSGSYTYSVTSGMANRPVVYVSWFDGARFANWLGNGQGSGDTEAGAYTLNGAMDGIIMVNSSATIHLPSEDEWYKAAYCSGASQSYSRYPNGQDTITTSEANHLLSVGSSTDVGSYGDTSSYYDTFDQGGNVWEWNDGLASTFNPRVGPDLTRCLRGGAWTNVTENLASSDRSGNTGIIPPSFESEVVGLRIASIPEPSALILTMLFGGVMLIRRK